MLSQPYVPLVDYVFPVEGAREVVVRIRSGEKYIVGAAEALQGLRGQIVKCNLASMYGDRSPGRAYLVRFHKPVKPWWLEGDSPKTERIREFWFAPSDLRKIRIKGNAR
jgi:hypothetical protein